MSTDRESAPLTAEQVLAIVEPFFADVLRILEGLEKDIAIILRHLDGAHGAAREFEPYDPAGGPL